MIEDSQAARSRIEHSPLSWARDDASLWPTALIVWRPGAEYRPRPQYSAQLILPFGDSVRVRLRRGAMWHRCAAVFAVPGTWLEIDPCGSTLVVGFVDPGAYATVPPPRPSGPRVAAVPEAVVERWRGALGDPETLDNRRLDSWARSELASWSHQRTMHPSVRRVVHYVRGHGLEQHGTSLARLAQVGDLSPSRLMHVFTQSLGIPLRPYILWRRVQHASTVLALGYTVTEAAYIAGFADAPHLTRTVRRLLGITPRQLMTPATGDDRHPIACKRLEAIAQEVGTACPRSASTISPSP
jgi:AraC-like DNA-binding protein